MSTRTHMTPKRGENMLHGNPLHGNPLHILDTPAGSFMSFRGNRRTY